MSSNSEKDDKIAPDTGIPSPQLVQSAQVIPNQLGYKFGLGRKGFTLIAAVAVFLWLVSGIYKVQPDEQGVVLRFGKWVETSDPGIHYRLPAPIETILLPKVTSINQLQLGKVGITKQAANILSAHIEPEFAPLPAAQGENINQMLTGDENIVEADCAVFWQIKDVGNYLFKVYAPEKMLKVAAESALREVIGRNPIQAALSDRRQQIADDVKDSLQHLLDAEQAGILVTQVQLQRVDPPAAVIDAFNDVQRARADKERLRNEAEAYRNDILPRARGEAERINQDAEAYKTQVVNLAQGDAQSFLSVYATYTSSRDATAWRLYLDSVDQVLKKANKVIIDSSGKGMSGVVPYMPLSETSAKPTTAQGAAQ